MGLNQAEVLGERMSFVMLIMNVDSGRGVLPDVGVMHL
jgi:hypothetical protein